MNPDERDKKLHDSLINKAFDNFFGNPVQRIDAIINQMFQQCIDEAGGQEGVDMLIRQKKVSLIEDILKCGKCLNGFCLGYSDYLNPDTSLFDSLYDQNIDALELMLAEMSAKLSQQARAAIEWKGIR